MMIDNKVGVSGHFTIYKNGEKVGEFDNLITNAGMDMLANARWVDYVRLGTGTNTPDFGDTALQSQVAVSGQATKGSSTGAADGSWSEMPFTWTFAQGAVVGNLTEIGTSPSASGNLFSRALIVDESGQPTTITATAIDILTVVYSVRFYFDKTDKTTTVVSDGVTYTITSRACQLTARRANAWYDYGHTGDTSQGTTSPLKLRTGASVLGPVTEDITGGSSNGSSANAVLAAYTAGSHTRLQSFPIGLADANAAGGITGWTMWEGNERRSIPLQSVVSPPIPKTNLKTMTVTIRYSWSRYSG